MTPVLALDIDVYEFACDGALWGIPHFANVISNLPFLFVGSVELLRLHRSGRWNDPATFAWKGLWVSTALLAFASSIYHWFLTPGTLALDRAAIAGIMGFLGAHVFARGLGLTPGRRLAWILFALSEATVIAWVLGATPWIYGAAQALGGLAALGVLVVAARNGRTLPGARWLVVFLLAYGASKVFEALDAPICEATGVIGGHPLKHLAAAAGLWWLGRMMQEELRQPEAPIP